MKIDRTWVNMNKKWAHTRKNVTQTECASCGPMKPYWSDSFPLIWLNHFNGHKHDRILHSIVRSTLRNARILCIFQMDKCNNVVWNKPHSALYSFHPPLPLSPDCCFSSYNIDIFPKHMSARERACMHKYNNLGVFFFEWFWRKRKQTPND